MKSQKGVNPTLELDENYKDYQVQVQKDGRILVYRNNSLFLQEKLSTTGMFQDKVALKLAIQSLIDATLLINESKSALDDAIKRVGGDFKWKPMD